MPNLAQTQLELSDASFTSTWPPVAKVHHGFVAQELGLNLVFVPLILQDLHQ